MKAFLAFLKIDLKLASRNRAVLFFNYVFPLIFFFAFAVFLGGQRGQIVLVVTMVTVIGILGSGFFGAGMRAVQEREENILRRYKVTPITPVPLLLASIVTGTIYTVEAAALGAIVATVYAWARGELNWQRWAETVRMVMRLTGMMFLLLMGASTFTLVFRGLNGTQAVHGLLAMLPGGLNFAVFAVFAVTFCFGFFLDALEIVLLVVPIAMPPLLALGAPPLWITALMALTVQTSFLMPPSGFALFFLRSIAHREVTTRDIYRGALPFIVIQLFAIALLWRFPELATALPALLD